jgi:hypothetical protein
LAKKPTTSSAAGALGLGEFVDEVLLVDRAPRFGLVM